MFRDNVFSDDYVAQLLTEDAKESSIKYSSYGLRAFLPKRPTTNAPRPNKRFLLNILRDTDNHNAALRAKEIAEARSRLRDIDREDARKKRHESRDEGRDSGGRHERKRRRIDYSRYDDHERHSRHHRSRSHREDVEGTEGARRHQRRHRGTYSDDTVHENSDRPRHRHRWRRSKSRSTEPEQRRPKRKRSRHRPLSASQPSKLKSSSESGLHHRPQRRQRPRSLSVDRRDTASNRHTKDEHRKPPSSTARGRSHTPSSLHSSSPPSRPQSPAQASDSSDPLEPLIGPAPPSAPPKVAPRGRGAFTATAKAFDIDTHFAANYDPALDVLPNSDTESDWDQALEALKDRQRWRQSGAERLRAAGFTEEE
ncbi:MAG: hypothetical protein Q9214_007669, partial [Letrouitia sp. 1 TL-2023]